MLLKSNIEDLQKIVKAKVLSSEEERFCYAQDAANIKQVTSLPDTVIFVESIEEVQNVLKYANTHRIPVISRGAGTNMVGACTCTNGGIILNFSKMNKILDFNPENMTMRVQPGVVLEDIKKLAESKGLFYPPDPSNFKVSTIGGSIAQSSGGAKAFKYGTTKDYILSLTVVLTDGTIMKLGSGTMKDAVGYHLNQLIIGSEGTLAIVVEAELKLIPKPETTVLVMSYFDDVELAVNSVNNIIEHRIFPSTIDFMDKNSIITAEQYCSCGLNIQKDCMLLIELDGNLNYVSEQSNAVSSVLLESGASEINKISDKDKQNAFWTARRSSFASTARLGMDVVSDDLIVPRTSLLQLIKGCRDICDKYNLKLCLVGHVGDGNIHPQIALNIEDENEFKAYCDARSEIYQLVILLGGAISSEHGIGAEKIDYAEATIDHGALEYMKKIKLLFDPNNILNPGKIFKI